MKLELPHQVKKIRRRKLFFFMSTLLGMFLFLIWIKNLLVSFIIAFVMYFLLKPFTDFLERRGLSRTAATTLPFLAVSTVFFIAASLLLPSLVDQFESLQKDLPKYLAGSTQIISMAEKQFGGLLPSSSIQSLSLQSQAYLTEAAQSFFQHLPNHISNSLTILLLSPFLAFFMLIDGQQLIRKLLALVPNQFFELALNLNHQISGQMGGFIRARLFESILVALMIWVGLLILDFPYSLVLAIFAGLLNLIPYLGPLIGAAPAFLIATINGNSADFVWLATIYGAAQVIDTVIIVPFMVAKIVNLHPVVVVLSVIVGSQMMGVLGMIISIPLTSALTVTFSSLYNHLTEFSD